MATNAQSLVTSAVSLGYDALSDRMLKECLLLAAQNGGSGGGAFTYGNYAGGQPNFTPSGGTGAAIDTSNGTEWQYYNGAWH